VTVVLLDDLPLLSIEVENAKIVFLMGDIMYATKKQQ
jgi:hypothetical protein